MNIPDPLHPAIVQNLQSAIFRRLHLAWLHAACLIPLLAGSARASIAYGPCAPWRLNPDGAQVVLTVL